MPRRQPLSDRHVSVLRWIADGCPDHEWPDQSHKLSARALESRGLARVRRKGKLWHAVLTDDGQHYLDHGRYPDPQPPGPGLPLTPAGPGQAPGQAAAMTARLAVRQAVSAQDRRSLSAARARIARQAAHPSLLKDIPMRYKVVVSRVQTAWLCQPRLAPPATFIWHHLAAGSATSIWPHVRVPGSRGRCCW